ncbi:MAG: MarR family transcriptional regulator [Cyanobacteria bacterium]|nr:MarR family transcriptional regulator [Cyanobacteriota bacterium]
MSEKITGIHVWLVLMKAHQVLSKHSERSLNLKDMCFSDFVVLEILLHKGPMPINQIGDKLLLTSGSLTTAVDRLEKMGYTQRQMDPQDRRTRIVSLTPLGQEVIEALFQKHEAYFEAFMEILSQEERKSLIETLKKMGKHGESLL